MNHDLCYVVMCHDERYTNHPGHLEQKYIFTDIVEGHDLLIFSSASNEKFTLIRLSVCEMNRGFFGAREKHLMDYIGIDNLNEASLFSYVATMAK